MQHPKCCKTDHTTSLLTCGRRVSSSTSCKIRLCSFQNPSSSVLIFILVLVTHVHTTDIQCMQTLSMYSMGQMLTCACTFKGTLSNPLKYNRGGRPRHELVSSCRRAPCRWSRAGAASSWVNLEFLFKIAAGYQPAEAEPEDDPQYPDRSTRVPNGCWAAPMKTCQLIIISRMPII